MKKTGLALSLLFSFTALFSQDGSSGVNPEKKSISFYGSVATSRLTNANITADPYLDIHYPAGFNGGLAYARYFTRYVGVSIGVEYSMYKNELRCAQYTKSASTQLDSYGSPYYTITQADYTEKRKLNCIEIPVCLRLETKPMGSTAFFTDLGFKVCSAVSSSMKSSGGITTMGLYPDPNYSNAGFLVWNQAVTGWQTSPHAASNDYTCKNLSWAFSAQAGVYVPLSSSMQLICAAYCTIGLGDINDSEKGLIYTNYLGQQTAYAPSKIMSFGLRLGVMLPVGTN